MPSYQRLTKRDTKSDQIIGSTHVSPMFHGYSAKQVPVQMIAPDHGTIPGTRYKSKQKTLTAII